MYKKFMQISPLATGVECLQKVHCLSGHMVVYLYRNSIRYQFGIDLFYILVI